MSSPATAAGRYARFEQPGALAFVLWVIAVAFVVWSFSATGLSLERLARGVPTMGGIIERMFPPNLDRLDRILASLLVTFQMAVAGCVLGLILSFPLAILAADGISPNPVLRVTARSLIARPSLLAPPGACAIISSVARSTCRT